MGPGGVARYHGGVRRYVTPRCLALHATLLVLLPAFAWLTAWQYQRATGGNSLSWAYVFLWPAFAVYAVYTWWNLVQDQVARQEGRTRGAPSDPTVASTSTATSTDPAAPSHQGRPPGWALTGGRKRNIAIAAAAPIDAETGGKGERFAAQTPEEAARLAEYNRYLEALSAEDDRAGRPAGGTR
jgi:hypothetical protein